MRTRHAITVLGLLTLTSVWACETEEKLNIVPSGQAVGATVTAGPGPGSGPTMSGSGGGGCVPDPACEVSFADDIHAGWLDDPNVGGCSKEGCHDAGSAEGGLVYPSVVADAHASLLAYQLGSEGAYIVPCDPAASKMLCNMKVPNDFDNPFGECGSTMPVTIGGPQRVTEEQLNMLAAWIECGAPLDSGGATTGNGGAGGAGGGAAGGAGGAGGDGGGGG